MLRNLAVIGEAVKALPAEFKAAHSEVPWPSIAGLRNVVVHEYFRVNPDLIRDILADPLARLAAAVDHSATELVELTSTFIESPGRGIDLQVGDEWPGINGALADSVSSLPPRGDKSAGLSTYWIDLLIDRLETWLPDPGEEMMILSGNTTELVRVDDVVIARSLYELFDDEQIQVATLLQPLRRWRARVLQVGGASGVQQ